MITHFIAIDLVKIYKTTEKKAANLKTVLAWGDEVEVIEITTSHIKIGLKDFKEQPDGSILAVTTVGFILKASGGRPALSDMIKPIVDKDVLMVSFVDVQQGDGCVIETPKGKVLLLDGGENQLFARYLAARYSGSSLDNPKEIECIIVSHGDADHFKGLPEILKSETNENSRKRLFIDPRRVYHNGIIKRPSTNQDGTRRKDTELLGATSKVGGELFITGLVDDLLEVESQEMNAPFKSWKKALKEYHDTYGNLTMKRLDNTSEGDFDFLDAENIDVQVLGPIIGEINNKPALKFLRQPRKSVVGIVNEDENATPTGSFSASHTINGHSVILRLKYGNVSFIFAGDLNEEAEEILVDNQDETPIQSEILKVPHHGSADFSNSFFEAVKPLVSVVSSGDESEMKEYIHPRATLMGALGKHSRIDRPLIFVTELVAFFKKEGWAKLTSNPAKEFFAFSRTAFGVVHVRTDGKKILVFTHSGQKGLKESYSYLIANDGDIPVRQDIVMA
jgi:beta-lactamase superfamily II metal-dependent hydrolase